MRSPGGAGDGHDILALGQHPSQSQLRRFATFFRGDLFDTADKIQIAFEILALEARMIATPILGRQVFYAPETAR
jgi:hypothetical protein